MIDDMHTGLNSFHYLHEYSYLDTTYEIYYGHDLILKTPEAKKIKHNKEEDGIIAQHASTSERPSASASPMRHDGRTPAISSAWVSNEGIDKMYELNS